MAWFACLGGLALLVLALSITLEARDFAANAVAVSGEIVGVQESGGRFPVRTRS